MNCEMLSLCLNNLNKHLAGVCFTKVVVGGMGGMGGVGGGSLT